MSALRERSCGWRYCLKRHKHSRAALLEERQKKGENIDLFLIIRKKTSKPPLAPQPANLSLEQVTLHAPKRSTVSNSVHPTKNNTHSQ